MLGDEKPPQPHGPNETAPWAEWDARIASLWSRVIFGGEKLSHGRSSVLLLKDSGFGAHALETYKALCHLQLSGKSRGLWDLSYFFRPQKWEQGFISGDRYF